MASEPHSILQMFCFMGQCFAFCLHEQIMRNYLACHCDLVAELQATSMTRSCQRRMNTASSTVRSCRVCRCLAFLFSWQINILLSVDDDSSFPALTFSHLISWISRFPFSAIMGSQSNDTALCMKAGQKHTCIDHAFDCLRSQEWQQMQHACVTQNRFSVN